MGRQRVTQLIGPPELLESLDLARLTDDARVEDATDRARGAVRRRLAGGDNLIFVGPPDPKLLGPLWVRSYPAGDVPAKLTLVAEPSLPLRGVRLRKATCHGGYICPPVLHTYPE